MRFPVVSLLEYIASGMTTDEILADFPYLEADDIIAALEFAVLVTDEYAQSFSNVKDIKQYPIDGGD